MSTRVKTQQVTLEELGQWHGIARGATADQLAIAFRSRRDVERRHLLRHNFHVHFTSLVNVSSATQRAGVEAAQIEIDPALGEQILEWTKTREGLRTIGAHTVAMDVLFRLLEDMSDELPSKQTWSKVGPTFMDVLRQVCDAKIEEIDRDHDSRPALQTMMRLVLVQARRFVQVPNIWHVPYREIFTAMLRPAGLFIEMGRMRRMGVENPKPLDKTPAWRDLGSDDARMSTGGIASPERLEPFDNAPDLDELIARRDRDSADMLTRPMGHPVLREDMPDDDVWDLGGEHDLVDD